MVKNRQSRDREAAWPDLGEQRQTWWRSCSPGTCRQPDQASSSSDRPGRKAAVQGQGGSLVRPRPAVTDLVKKLHSRNREAAWSGLDEQRQTWWRSCSPWTGMQPGQASASSDRPGWRSCRLEFSLEQVSKVSCICQSFLFKSREAPCRLSWSQHSCLQLESSLEQCFF